MLIVNNPKKQPASKNKNTLTHNPHDSFFRISLSDHATAVELCTVYLPKKLVKRINFNTLKMLKQHYVDEDLRSYASDVVFECELKPIKTSKKTIKKLRLAILIEHQSTPDRFMVFRIYHYMFKLLNNQLKQSQSKQQKLPPVYPIIFYNGLKTPYPYSLNLLDCFDDPYNIMKLIFTKPVPLVDVGQIDDKTLIQQNTLGVMTRAMKFRMATNSIDEKVDYLSKLLNDLNCKIPSGKKLSDYSEPLINYLVNFAEINELRAAIKSNRQLPESVRGEYMSAAEEWFKEGIEKGIEKGRETERKLQEQIRLEEKLQQAKLMLSNGLSLEQIAMYTGLSIEQLTKALK